jgi:hypothetical protein
MKIPDSSGDKMMPYPLRFLVLILLVFSLFLLHPAFIATGLAQEEETARLRQRVIELEQQIKILEAHLAETREHQIHGPNGWQNRKNWRRLEVGMGQKEVLEILGQPIRVIGGDHTLWYYPNTYCGYCSFDKDGNLEAWAEP